MKKWIIKHKIRLIISLIMIIAGIVLGFIFDGFIGPGSEMWQRVLYIFFVMGTVLSGVVGLIGGLKAYVAVYIFFAIIILPHALPEPFNRYYAFVYLAAMFTLPYLMKNRKKNKSEKDEAADGSEDGSYSLEGSEYEGPSECIIANNIYSGRWYQIFKRGGFIYCFFIGGELKGPSAELIQDTEGALRKLGKKDFCFAAEDILKIRVNDISNGSYSKVALIKTAKKTFRFWEIGEAHDSFLTFWQSLSPEPVLDKESLANMAEPEPDENRKRRAKKLIVAYGAYILAVALAWLFLEVPYKAFAILNLLGMPVLLVLYFLFPGEITVCEAKKSSKKHSISMLVIFSGVALSLRVLLDFNIINWQGLLAAAAVIAAVHLVLILLFSKEWRAKKAVFAYIILGLLIYSPGAAMELNYILDFSEPLQETAIIERMRVSTGSNSPDSYIIEVTKGDGSSQEIEISKAEYEAFRPGDSVDIYTYPGFLGIEYVVAE